MEWQFLEYNTSLKGGHLKNAFLGECPDLRTMLLKDKFLRIHRPKIIEFGGIPLPKTTISRGKVFDDKEQGYAVFKTIL